MNDSVLVLSIASALVAGTPILLAALGEIVTERAGVMNLGVEGMMLVGAVSAFWAGVHTGNLAVALLVGGLAGSLLSLVHAVLAITLRVNQTVSGLSLVIVGSGLSAFIGNVGDSPLLEAPNGVDVDPLLPAALADVPVLGPIVFGHDIVVYLAFAAVAVTGRVLYRTTFGLSLRAVGEDPAAADAAGLPVTRIRYLATAIGGFGAGVGGGYLVLAVLGTWQTGMTAGAGWIAVALVILAGWRPWLALIGAYVFGALRGLGFTLQIAQVDIPSDFLTMIPFVAAYLVVVLVSASPTRARRVAAPAALGEPYRREER
ncbi:MAG: ABC transporter permease [Actinobacteria bacterium]|nr:ABC transporter permease [Actinomycetota bacterium]